jgi:hypothetical protein
MDVPVAVDDKSPGDRPYCTVLVGVACHHSSRGKVGETGWGGGGRGVGATVMRHPAGDRPKQ